MSASRMLVCAVVAGLVLIGAGSAVAAAPAVPQMSIHETGQIPAYLPEVVLYDQNNNASGSGTSSQNFEASFDPFDNQTADDFVVPAGGWAIDNVTVTGSFSAAGPVASVHVTFYANSGTLPGAAVAGCDYPAVIPTGAPSFSLALAPPCALAPGTYWVSVQANMDFGVGGQWYWTNRTLGAGSPAAWQNPGGGFGAGCLTWGVRSTCVVGDTSPDQMFSLSGVTTPVELMGFGVE